MPLSSCFSKRTRDIRQRSEWDSDRHAERLGLSGVDLRLGEVGVTRPLHDPDDAPFCVITMPQAVIAMRRFV